MNKHTPGPWVIIPGGDEWSSGRIATIEQKPETMVETNYWTVTEVNYRRDEHLANAKLIAAAPDLLAALERCELLLRAKRHACEDNNLCHLLDSHISQARNAIAKATQ